MAKSNRLLQYFGSNTENAPRVGELLRGCGWVGIPFGGGMSEVPWIDAGTIVVSDLHRHVINLCGVVADDEGRAWLARQADFLPYHPEILAEAQDYCRRELDGSLTTAADCHLESRQLALAYFVSQWMGRGGNAGTDREFSGSLPMRWNGNGGGSNRRYRTAIEALDDFGKAFRRCEFVCLDAFEFLEKPIDKPGNGLYLDPPWPDAGDSYRHKFTESQQRELAMVMAGFQVCRIVIRYGDHPLIRELYAGWDIIELSSRDQANQSKPELLITRRVEERRHVA